MDEDYAKLSLFAGWFAGCADGHLGYPHFGPKIRAQAWELTIDKLAKWKMEAVRLGVPVDVLDPSKEEVRLMPELLRIGRLLQLKVDRMTGHDN